MTKVKPKQLAVIQGVMEEALKKKCIKVEVDSPLSCMLFPYDATIPKSMGELREELEQRGFLMFYSKIIKDGEEYLSINVVKQ